MRQFSLAHLQPAVADLARAAATAAAEAAPSSREESLKIAEVELAASVVGTRAHLVKARSAEAFTVAQMVGGPGPACYMVGMHIGGAGRGLFHFESA